jgi:pimeloyl-ACP methyl ester carboxylesterase
MPFVRTEDDCEIYYESHGEGQALVFCPGFMGITDIWRNQFAHFAGRYRCIAFDNRGAGRSDKPLPRIAYGVERHARDLHHVLGAAGCERAVLVGHSMGGNTASLYALAHPERVAGLVYVGSYVAGRQIAAAGNTLDRIKAAVATQQGRVDFYTAVGIPLDLAYEATKWPLYALLGNAESFMAFDLAARIGEIAAPSLVLHGDGDIVSPLEPCGTSLAAGLPAARLAVLDGVNHCPMLEAPEPCNTLIEAFLTSRVAW